MKTESIIRLDGADLGDGASVLVIHRLSTGIEIVVTEEHGSDAVVVLSREQAEELTRKLLAEFGGEDPYAQDDAQEFGRRGSSSELDRPPIARAVPDSAEVLRVWAAPGSPQQLTLRTCWSDPGAWGLLLADVARHAAQAYEREGHDAETVLRRIRELFDAEWSSPTDDPEDLTDGE